MQRKYRVWVTLGQWDHLVAEGLSFEDACRLYGRLFRAGLRHPWYA